MAATGGRAAIALRPGDVVAERYRVMRALGAGGMGEVHEVERLADRRRFALKVLTRATDRDALMRFAREAEIAAKLDHPHVVG
ncbi:MAG: protein kinase, partial [Proteobacteria bacterium]|nr:protein kinase [Pseudomonadota bacterium]